MNTVTTRIPTLATAIVADDDDVGRVLLAEAAEAAGLNCQSFDNGLDALDAAQFANVDIVLLDIHMPGVDGIEVCRRLRADVRFDGIPIVIVTGQDDSVAVRRAFEAGATDFVAKPVNWTLLPRRIEYILRNAAMARELGERMSQVRTLVEALPDSLWVVSAMGEIRWSSDQRYSNRRGDVAAAADADTVIAPVAHMPMILREIAETAADGNQRMLEFRMPGGESPRAFEIRLTRRKGGDVVVVRRETTERVAAAERIEHLAYYDPLTQLANRHQCLARTAAWMEDATARGESVALLYMDLDSFKRVNDTFGHAVGDTVLRAVAKRLSASVKPFATSNAELLVSRLGGDEFVIIILAADARERGIAVANACRDALAKPIQVDALEFHCAPSTGLAVYPEDGGDAATLLKHADIAMYEAKSTGTGAVASYNAMMSNKLRDWLALEVRLRRAVREEMLRIEFQPKFNIDDLQVVGAEALLRWHDDEHGEVSPARFVEIAEDSGLILELSSWVVRAVCRQIRHWLDMGVAMTVAINCSPKELMHGDPAGVIRTETVAAGIPPSLIEVEITESLLMSDSRGVQQVLKDLRALGCRISLDDFGTRYSSLSYITQFPPDRIKIDKAFIQNVDRSPADAAIATAILSLTSSLGLDTTAEGVEREEQLQWLRQHGCQEGQGYLISRPLSPTEFTRRYVAPAQKPAATSVISC
jgi:diguanylate cyclase (GGDEF)-like protein